ncbi:peptidoglycan editing factor PgeF [Marinomonas foliarum]|uniref:Purine nucleoside phosphorylase n=1 Tax=Marinomonas foliarum TaxID=491950 RepID=A0A368ZNS9_9GAMM|nr:peptidoglycan editing factor PgeF [Marinomonas foliarum]RCW94372.1 hypothetical protein DFP77_14723 [Marinomonas foliarum]
MASHPNSYILPTWPAPASVCAYVSTRMGGVSNAPFDGLNLGLHVQDDPAAVNQNRKLFASCIDMPDSTSWLNQVHGIDIVQLPCDRPLESADAATSRTINQVCAVLTADCLPVFFCDQAGTQVAVAHAGWRGLCAGVLESTLAQFDEKDGVMAWLGPAIGPSAFEVGDEVREAFMLVDSNAALAFRPSQQTGKWLADLYLLARQRLLSAGIKQVYGGDYCTFTDRERFFSYRRDGMTGRMASVIWLKE